MAFLSFLEVRELLAAQRSQELSSAALLACLDQLSKLNDAQKQRSDAKLNDARKPMRKLEDSNAANVCAIRAK